MYKKPRKDTQPAAESTELMEKSATDQAPGECTSCESLTQKIQEKEKEAGDNYDKYVRAVAELENYKKRAARDRADCLKYGQESLIKDLLPLVDSLERASEYACNSSDFDAFKEGLQLIRSQLSGCLAKQGVEPIEAVGCEFDPNIHHALMQVESPDHEHNQVVQELEKGYMLNGRLLRPAKVSVCRLKSNTDSKY